MTLVQDVKVSRDITFEELDKENEFLVRYVVADKAPYSANAPKWTGRGPSSLLAWVLLGATPTQADMPTSSYEFDAIVGFMERVPEHLDKLLQPMYTKYRQYYLELEERRARVKILTGNQYAYIAASDVIQFTEWD